MGPCDLSGFRPACALLSVMVFGLCLSATAASAQSSAEVPERSLSAVGHASNALPGFERVAVAQPSRWLLAASLQAGYGYTEDALNLDDSHHRLSARLALSVQPVEFLQIGLRLDGRYDSHSGTGIDDDGLVGDPRLVVRGILPLGVVNLGLQGTAWLPGRDAPSFDFAATSVDLEALGTVSLSALTLSANAGFRINNSAAAAEDADLLSLSDRFSLGASDSSAVLLGLGGAYTFGSQQLFAEWTWDVLVGSRAPSMSGSPMRVGAGFRMWLLDDQALQLQLGIEALLSGRPPNGFGSPLTPNDPRIAGHLAVAYRFPSDRAPAAPEDRLIAPPPDDQGGELGVVEGRARDSDGAPVGGAEVVLSTSDGTTVRTTTTDASGRYRFDEVPVGDGYTLVVRAEGYREQTATLAVVAGQTARSDVEVPRDLPSGQIRGVVQSFSGQPISAQVLIEPIGGETRTDSDGVFEFDVPPGAYTVRVTAEGFEEQTRPVVVEEQGVTILNMDLRSSGRSRRRPARR